MEIPDLIKLYDKYHSKGVEVIGLSSEGQDLKPQDYFKKFISQYGMDYPVGLAGTETLADYGIRGIPASFFIDKQGKVALSFVGVHPEEDFTAAVDQLLKE
jgi:peroxiredoxin